ncbi:class I SAM-dependent methyltransferase [Cellulomonas sp. P5_C6]
MSDPADFYTGLVAELYGPLRSFTSDPAPYASFIRASGEPALELGCGDGDPLLDLRALGLDVDGVDSSADMLDRLRRAAAARELAVTVFRQRMEELDLPRRYRSIFLAGATFNLLPSDDVALRALRAIRAHLTDDGSALVPLFVPGPTPAVQIGVFREAFIGGAVLRVAVVHESLDHAARVRRTTLRYERVADGVVEVAEREWLLHWYTRAGFEALAVVAGLEPTTVADPEDAAAVTVTLRVR